MLFERVNLYILRILNERTQKYLIRRFVFFVCKKKTLITRFLFFSRFPHHATLVTIKSTHAHGKTSFLNDDDDDDITLTDDDDDVITCENAPPPP